MTSKNFSLNLSIWIRVSTDIVFNSPLIIKANVRSYTREESLKMIFRWMESEMTACDLAQYIEEELLSDEVGLEAGLRSSRPKSLIGRDSERTMYQDLQKCHELYYFLNALCFFYKTIGEAIN